MRLLLIRHGQTTSNASGALDTRIPGAELTSLGQAQAQAIPEALAGEPVAAVYASRLVRTQMTAAPLAAARQLSVVVQPGLEEISAGDLEMKSDPPSRQAYIDCLTQWVGGNLDEVMPGGHDGHAFLARYRSALASLLSAHDGDDTVAVVSHGAAIRVFTALTATLGPDVPPGLPLLNTGMATLVGEPSDWVLDAWRSDPLGGPDLDDAAAVDPTGESQTTTA
ncbi:histidine phosphatase family protein [Mumia sp. DW29H23]|uniref:histidine phosphatase family protein n=1 Tax=Mumia sp. DW29H23 TaxID=3421241 RepID=UPI003D69B59B